MRVPVIMTKKYGEKSDCFSPGITETGKVEVNHSSSYTITVDNVKFMEIANGKWQTTFGGDMPQKRAWDVVFTIDEIVFASSFVLPAFKTGFVKKQGKMSAGKIGIDRVCALSVARLDAETMILSVSCVRSDATFSCFAVEAPARELKKIAAIIDKLVCDYWKRIKETDRDTAFTGLKEYSWSGNDFVTFKSVFPFSQVPVSKVNDYLTSER